MLHLKLRVPIHTRESTYEDLWLTFVQFYDQEVIIRTYLTHLFIISSKTIQPLTKKSTHQQGLRLIQVYHDYYSFELKLSLIDWNIGVHEVSNYAESCVSCYWPSIDLDLSINSILTFLLNYQSFCIRYVNRLTYSTLIVSVIEVYKMVNLWSKKWLPVLVKMYAPSDLSFLIFLEGTNLVFRYDHEFLQVRGRTTGRSASLYQYPISFVSKELIGPFWLWQYLTRVA